MGEFTSSFCLLREHAKELGNQVPKETPLIFNKPISSIITQESAIQVPSEWKELHHEVELGIIIGKEGKYIKEEYAMEHVAGYVLALDMTVVS